jgi:hypothetical protein
MRPHVLDAEEGVLMSGDHVVGINAGQRPEG